MPRHREIPLSYLREDQLPIYYIDYDAIEDGRPEFQDEPLSGPSAEELSAALNALSDKQKQVIYAVIWKGMTPYSYAITRGIPVTNAYEMYGRAIKKLRRLLSDTSHQT